MKYAFFGSADFSVFVLEELERQGKLPDLLVTTPDKPKGRKLLLSPNPAKEWALKKNIKIAEFKNLGSGAKEELAKEEWDVFLVAAYGKIILPDVFNIPKRQTLNIHPSLLPKYRGASPVEHQILNDEKDVGVSLMVIDEFLDHGPVVAQKKVEISDWPSKKMELEKILAEEGAKLFVEIFPKWLSGYIQEQPQDESKATFTTKLKKEDGLLDLNADAHMNLLKVKALEVWPTTYFFVDKDEKKMRVIITDAELEGGQFKILRVIPEGKKEMNYTDFLRGLKR